VPDAATHPQGERGLLPAFGPQSKVREVVATLGDRGRELLKKHGYDVGEGFVDVLSQYQTLEHAARTERLRNLDGLLKELNSAPSP
jgi:hypothetical protein